MSTDLVPASIDFSSASEVLEIDANEAWDTIPLLAASRQPKRMLGIFPSHLQLDARFYRAVRALTLPCFTAPREQMSASISLIDQLSVGAVVLMHTSITDYKEALESFRLKSAPYVQAILSPRDRVPQIEGVEAFFEVHVVPGLPVLYQCEHLKGTEQFHATTRFDASTFPREVSVRDVECACGADTIIERI